MIHPLVVAIDSTDSSQRAQTVSLDLAKQFSASVTGIAVLDTAWIRRPMATPIGGRAYKAHRDETLIQHQHEELEAKIKAFDELCKKAGVKSRSLEVEGSPSEKLDREAEQHDVLVLGRETNFHGTRD